jgi:hypothetical protein
VVVRRGEGGDDPMREGALAVRAESMWALVMGVLSIYLFVCAFGAKAEGEGEGSVWARVMSLG